MYRLMVSMGPRDDKGTSYDFHDLGFTNCMLGDLCFTLWFTYMFCSNECLQSASRHSVDVFIILMGFGVCLDLAVIF